MIPSEYEPLIKRLKERTEEGAVQWETTSEEDKFVARIGVNTVVINSYIAYPNDTPMTSFELLDAFGNKIDGIYLEFDDSDFYILDTLHALARRKALHIDETIDRLLKDLG